MAVYPWYRKSAKITRSMSEKQRVAGFSETDRWGVCVFNLMDPVWKGLGCVADAPSPLCSSGLLLVLMHFWFAAAALHSTL